MMLVNISKNNSAQNVKERFITKREINDVRTLQVRLKQQFEFNFIYF